MYEHIAMRNWRVRRTRTMLTSVSAVNMVGDEGMGSDGRRRCRVTRVLAIRDVLRRPFGILLGPHKATVDTDR